jgi:hypothetical protein
MIPAFSNISLGPEMRHIDRYTLQFVHLEELLQDCRAGLDLSEAPGGCWGVNDPPWVQALRYTTKSRDLLLTRPGLVAFSAQSEQTTRRQPSPSSYQHLLRLPRNIRH